MKFIKRLNAKKRRLFTEQQTYRTIKELPVFNYHNILDGHIDFMMKKPIDKPCYDTLGKAFENIQDEIIDSFGFTPEQQEVILKEQQITWLQCQVVLNPKSLYATKLKLVMAEYEGMVSEQQKGDFYEHLAIIEQYRGISIDVKTTSLYMWLTYKKLYEKHVEQIKRNAQNKKK